ncbi:3-dehydroshikimate dehydratase [Microlunatus endophyticus]|uniref:3-dehydroshikimate dehydratase n=1 Tax=Microlunatus endophyticus TaxID=1716077 RepID=A0A917SE81_9ACTN|nr:sugar phosphate isomerase/epimerase family protein [Microlunatus endophyticus]GGL75878.1 3-dehydroshikimate dehydratase [Microlunatus endophyticus]
MSPDHGRFSLNQATIKYASLAEALQVAREAGYRSIGLWREPVQEVGLDTAVALVAESGLRISSLCRGGFFTALEGAERAAALDDNRRALDEAHRLGTDTLVLVCGGLPAGSRDLAGARRRVGDALAALVPDALAAGVRLALEPLHPMYAADRAVINTLGQALDIAEQFPVQAVGVVVDTFHLWWDPDLLAQIARAGSDRITSYQICDWITPMPADNLLARGVPGDGHIDFAPLTRAVAATGYAGDIECEIFNADVWNTPYAEVAALVAERYHQLVEPHL